MVVAKITREDARIGMSKLVPQLERYADLIVRKGVNVKRDQEVVIRCPVERADFCRILVARAYAAGAGHVTVIWGDDVVSRLTYENVAASWFEQTPEWQRVQLDSLAEAGACFIFVEGADPAALKGIDPAKPAAASKAQNTQCRAFRHGLDFNINPWCIAGAPAMHHGLMLKSRPWRNARHWVFCAFEAAAGLAGSIPFSAAGSAPSTKMKHAPASARESSCTRCHSGVCSNQLAATFSYVKRETTSSPQITVTCPAPAAYARATRMRQKSARSTGHRITTSWSRLTFTPLRTMRSA